jgi:hypothetical protein
MYHRIPVHNMLTVFHILLPNALSDNSSSKRILMIACHSVCTACTPHCEPEETYAAFSHYSGQTCTCFLSLITDSFSFLDIWFFNVLIYKVPYVKKLNTSSHFKFQTTFHSVHKMSLQYVSGDELQAQIKDCIKHDMQQKWKYQGVSNM